ncbi:MAG: hypothetical protein OJF47_002842 [Nitrospira sp.]|nr:MAG: hypothetical protein OJF47_002842 [Nitrospira sp.]
MKGGAGNLPTRAVTSVQVTKRPLLIPRQPRFRYGRAVTLDQTHYYRLTTKVSGNDSALDVCPDGSCRVMLAAPADSSGQYWNLVPTAGSRYALRTGYLGDGLSLTMDDDRMVCLKPTDPSAGQSWDVRQEPSGTYAIINDLAGPQTCLCPDGQGVITAQQVPLPQRPLWTLTKLASVSGQAAVPDLKQAPGVYCPEGCTDFTFYARPAGPLKAVMLFVDFPDAPAGVCSPIDTPTICWETAGPRSYFSSRATEPAS